ncbi:MAG: hypothetical protein WCP29_17040, partial [Acidobacteriota bacterium]
MSKHALVEPPVDQAQRIAKTTVRQGRERAAVRTLCALVALLGWAEAHAQPPPLLPAKISPPILRPALPEAAMPGAAKVLLVDDDESDNNSNAASGKLSPSDSFYRKLLTDQSLSFDTVVVPRYADGPTPEKLKQYSLIVWYTGASYGGNRDNTGVISLRDEQSVANYLQQSGGTVLLFSPGYLNNALGAGGAAVWEKKDSAFLQKVLGIKGGRGLLQRFKEGEVVSSSGARYAVTKSPTVESQFSVVNPDRAQILFSTTLDPDGKGPRPVPVASSNSVGTGRLVYVGFTFENIAVNAGQAFGQLLQTTNSLPSSFNHSQAGVTGQCASCHTGTLPPADGKPANHVPYASVPAAAAANCDSCHKGSFSSWANGRFHANFSVSAQCSGCHTGNYLAAVGKPATPVHAGVTTCEGCHNSTSGVWTPASFDHSVTRFALTGKHVAVACASCHINGRFTGTPQACSSCHLSAFQKTTTPNHVAGGFPQDCATCHTTGAWRPASFDHSVTRFALTGKHV